MLELHDAPSKVRPAISAIDAGREIPLEQRMSPIVPFFPKLRPFCFISGYSASGHSI
jgi:hypothetical protein